MRDAQFPSNPTVLYARKTILYVDSGWGRDGVVLDFRTTRGQTVSLTLTDWALLKNIVDRIAKHCTERMLEKSEV